MSGADNDAAITGAAISLRAVTKRFGDVRAVREFDLLIVPGEVREGGVTPHSLDLRSGHATLPGCTADDRATGFTAAG